MTLASKQPDSAKTGRFTDYVDLFARMTPAEEAVVYERDRISYLELQRRVDTFAKALIASGVERGDRVAMLSAPRSEFLVCFLATIRIGAIWVGLNPKYTLAECRYVLSDATPRILFSIDRFGSTASQLDANVLKGAESDEMELVAVAGKQNAATDIDQFTARAEQVSDMQFQKVSEAVSSNDPALIVYTSGSSGQPKGAVLSHHSLCFGAEMQASHFGVASPSCVVNFPINHVACVADACATTLVKGGKIVFQDQFEPDDMLELIADERCTIWGGVPTMLMLQLQEPLLTDIDLSSVELIIWGGAAMPSDVISKLQRFGARLMTTYGMTETACNTTFTDEYADLECLAETVGKPDPACPCRIVNEHDELCEIDESGEIQFKGSYLMQQYWNRPDATRAAFAPDGWLRTGDLGYRRADGNIVLTGRLSEMYKSGGYKIFPREIEVVLESMTSIAAAAVVAVEDKLFQEVGHAFVILAPGSIIDESEIREWCKRFLANYKIPKQFVILPALPMLPVGKIDKQALKLLATNMMQEEKVWKVR